MTIDKDPVVLMQEKVTEYKKMLRRINTSMKSIKEKVTDVDRISNDINDKLANLNNDIQAFFNESKEILSEVDNYSSAAIKISGKQLVENEKNLKDKVRLFKRSLYEEYNKNVKLLQEEKNILWGMAVEFPSKLDEINALVLPNEINKVVRYNTSLRDLDYANIRKAIDDIREIGISMGVSVFMPSISKKMDLSIERVEINIKQLENDIVALSREVNSKISKDDLYNEIEASKNIVNEIIAKLSMVKGKISEIDYSDYLANLAELSINLDGLKTKLDNVEVKEYDDDIKKEYNTVKNEINTLIRDIVVYRDLISEYEGKFTSDYLEIFNNKMNKFKNKFDDIKKYVEDKYKDGFFDLQLYNNLNIFINKVSDELKVTNDLGKNSKMYVSSDRYSVLFNNIEDIEKIITELDKKIELAEKPINREVRKKIDTLIIYIEKEIARLERDLYSNEEKDEEKDKEIKEKLENVKVKLSNLGRSYRKKCPLLVRSVKSAKEFYKKHKKICLIAAGLAAIALLHATVGPILIPAIMHGNIMLENTSLLLGGFANAANNVLGGLINATLGTDGLWKLANGVIINPSVASTSLLKGLAISGLGTGAIIGTGAFFAKQLITKDMIEDIKKLVEKMKRFELKEKLNNAKDNVKNKVNSGKESIKQKVNNTKNNINEKVKTNVSKTKTKVKETFVKVKQSAKKTEKEQLKETRRYFDLYAKYVKTGISFEDFCEKESLEESEIEYFKEIVNTFESKTRGGRK